MGLYKGITLFLACRFRLAIAATRHACCNSCTCISYVLLEIIYLEALERVIALMCWAKETMMSQQEFVPGPQDQEDQQDQQQPENEEEISVYPYHWAGNSSAEAVPRDEPPSSYEYEAGYQAQDAYASPPSLDSASEYTQPAQQQMQQMQTPQYQYNPYDGDAYEQGYNPYNSSTQNNMNQQGVPPWARRHRRAAARHCATPASTAAG